MKHRAHTEQPTGYRYRNRYNRNRYRQLFGENNRPRSRTFTHLLAIIIQTLCRIVNRRVVRYKPAIRVSLLNADVRVYD